VDACIAGKTPEPHPINRVTMHSLSVKWFSRHKASEYEELYSRCPHALVQQSTAWADVICSSLPDTPYFGVAYDDTGKALAGLPVYHFNGKYGGILTSVPHAGPLGGIFHLDSLYLEVRTDVYRMLTDAMIDFASKLGCVSCSVISNPFWQNTDIYQSVRKPQYVFKNFCQSVFIPDAFTKEGRFDAHSADYNQNIHYRIGLASRRGYEIRTAGMESFNEWYAIHVERHTEIGATPLPQSLLASIVEILPQRNMGGLIVAVQNNRIKGGFINIWNTVVADAFMMSSSGEALKDGANWAMTEYSIRKMAQSSRQWYNFQSSGRNSGVYDFKRRFGAKEIEYCFLTWTLPGFESIIKAGADEISKHYQWHYAAPFAAIKAGLKEGVFVK
jgi:hypothetical protein